MTTELITENPTTGLQTRSFIRDGVAGNVQVIFAMVRLIRASVQDRRLETFAKGKGPSNLFPESGYSSYQESDYTFHAIFNYVKNHVAFTLDEAGAVENIKSAWRTLQDGFGDCDDQAILNASLLGVLGFEDVRIAMARYSEADANFSHVYCVLYYQGKRYVFDTTLPEAQFNREARYFEIKEIPVFQSVPGFDGFSGIFGNLKHYAKTSMRTGIRALPYVATVLPMGFAAGKALDASAELLERSTGAEALSVPAIGAKINKELDSIIRLLIGSQIALDSAKSQALQVASQLSAIKIGRRDKRNFEIVKNSVAAKLRFIDDFESYATANGIRCVYLDSRMILLAGLGLAGITGYVLYKSFKREVV